MRKHIRLQEILAGVIFSLLFLTLGGLMLQGGICLLIGALGWFGVVLSWFLLCNYKTYNKASN